MLDMPVICEKNKAGMQKQTGCLMWGGGPASPVLSRSVESASVSFSLFPADGSPVAFSQVKARQGLERRRRTAQSRKDCLHSCSETATSCPAWRKEGVRSLA